MSDKTIFKIVAGWDANQTLSHRLPNAVGQDHEPLHYLQDNKTWIWTS